MAETTTTSSGVSPRAVAFTVLAILAAGVLVWLVEPLHEAAGFALRGDTTGLKEQLNDLGVWGVLVLLGIILAHAVIPYPAEIPTAAAGFVYGFALALPMLLVAWLLSALVTYAMGRHAGRSLLYRLAGRARFTKAERTIDRGGAPVLLAARLIPVMPFSLTGYVAGAVRVPLFRFSWTTVVGFAPLTIVFCLLGSRLEELSLTDPVLYIALAPIAALLFFAKPLHRRMKEHEAEDEGEPEEAAETRPEEAVR